MHRWRLALLAAVGALVLSGCLRFSADLTVEPDDTVSGQYVVAVKKGTAENYGMSDAEMAKELWADYPRAETLKDATFADYSADGFVGIKVTFADAPLADFAPTASDWGIARVGDDFVVSGPSNAVTQAAQSELPEGNVLSDLADAEFTVGITFPGDVIEHNGSAANRTVTWNLNDAPPELSARGSAIPKPDRATPLAWFAVAVLLVGAVAYGSAGRIARRNT
ncbi:hypothetical protein LGT39_12680 [Demequina sp. TTPB684]|uniref:LppM family (lipo)protein n=1 Tax=unclassified Demequina TaxID=2620311 RepID=UPI001CF40B23|nr:MULTISPECIES: hypothetical protein [unclassified Demequina]MCB2413698.1 hypothetical protein [Demequina sp. TTPB684]UPU87760.1 hypothetical protein LGT36_010935 [Demequina sp. TMPB413]